MDIGLYEFMSLGSLLGLRIGLTIEVFHSTGIEFVSHERFIMYINRSRTLSGD